MVKSYDRYVLGESFGVVCAPACNILSTRDGRRAITGAWPRGCLWAAHFFSLRSKIPHPSPLPGALEDVLVWDLKRGAQVHRLRAEAVYNSTFSNARGAVSVGECTALALRPDGARVAAGYADGFVRVWDLEAGT